MDSVHWALTTRRVPDRACVEYLLWLDGWQKPYQLPMLLHWKLEAAQQGHACRMGITGYYWRVVVRPEAPEAEVAWGGGCA